MPLCLNVIHCNWSIQMSTNWLQNNEDEAYICRSLARNRALLYQLSKLPVFVLSDISIHCLNEAVVKVLWFDIHIFMYLYTYCTSQILCLEKVVLFHKVFIAHVCTLHIVCFCAESIKAWHCFINAVSDYNPLSASQINTIVGY